MKIEIIGPYPPPYGGVSLHINRLTHHLENAKINYLIWNQYKFENPEQKVFSTKKYPLFLWWVYYLFRKKATIVHFHEFSPFLFVYVLLFSFIFNGKLFITIHNEKLIKRSWIYSSICILLLKSTLRLTILAASSSVSKFLANNDVQNVFYLPAYVPPKPNKKKLFKTNGGKKIVFNAWRIKNTKDARVYGLDILCVLALIYTDNSFYIFTSRESSFFLDKYLDEKKHNNIYIIYDEVLVDYLWCADVFIRLNREDAYGVSIQEALDLSVPAIASNVCLRPPGCILFVNDDIEDLINKFNFILQSHPSDSIRGRQNTNFHLELVGLYKRSLPDIFFD